MKKFAFNFVTNIYSTSMWAAVLFCVMFGDTGLASVCSTFSSNNFDERATMEASLTSSGSMLVPLTCSVLGVTCKQFPDGSCRLTDIVQTSGPCLVIRSQQSLRRVFLPFFAKHFQQWWCRRLDCFQQYGP